MATHPTPARQPWDRLGWGRTRAPRLLGLPLGSASTQGAAWGSALSILLPQTRRHAVLLRGMCHPSNLSEHQNLCPSSRSPSSCSLSPLPQQHPGPPQPLAGTAPQGAQGAGGVCRGCQAAASWAGSPSCPRPPQGQDVHPTSSNVAPLPIPLSPEPPSAPRMGLGTWGLGTIPRVGDNPSCRLLGERREASGGKLPVKDGYVSSLCPA